MKIKEPPDKTEHKSAFHNAHNSSKEDQHKVQISLLQEYLLRWVSTRWLKADFI